MILHIVDSMDSILGNIPIASASETKEVLDVWNNTEDAQFLSEDLIYDQVRSVSRKYPDSVALVVNDEHLTFRELDRRSDQLCSYLLSIGVTSESMVAVSLYRSIELIVALVGIIKCGASYVPIDPAYPEARRLYMLNDSKANVLITTTDGVRADDGVSIIINQHWNHIAREVDIDLIKKAVNASNSMYVIYTSGSTGNPKGVVLQHRGLTNRLLSMANLLNKKSDSDEVRDVSVPSDPREVGNWADHRILQKTSVCFDVSVWELFLPLISGCCMVLLEHQQEKDPRAIIEAINTQSISMLHFVPTMLSAFVTSGKDKIADRCTSLDYVVTSGEALDIASASAIQVRSSSIYYFLTFFRT